MLFEQPCKFLPFRGENYRHVFRPEETEIYSESLAPFFRFGVVVAGQMLFESRFVKKGSKTLRPLTKRSNPGYPRQMREDRLALMVSKTMRAATSV
jgi:hypothetical protein